MKSVNHKKKKRSVKYLLEGNEEKREIAELAKRYCLQHIKTEGKITILGETYRVEDIIIDKNYNYIIVEKNVYIPLYYLFFE